ncbi:MAG: NADH-quinone oxidoreductase subunit NuoB [Coriobacteriaceae bacterium]|nr:NADH-quinone oxidoreductase subunit NuoB [Coriobacteriaceae bacterium]
MPHASKSPWIIHYDGSSCNGCDIEVLAALTPLYDAERFGVINTGNPKHADIFVVTGSVNDQNESVVRQIYDQMLEPKVVVACGACACGGGVYHTCYNVNGGIDTVIPVDVYVPGCAIRPEALIDGIVTAIGILDEKSKELNGISTKPRGYADAGEGVYAPQADVADKTEEPAEAKAAAQGGDGR